MLTPRTVRMLARMLLLVFLTTLAPAPALAAPPPSRLQRLEQATGKQLFHALKASLVAICQRASGSERLRLDVKMAMIDDDSRIFFDVQGSARVKVPGESWRAKLVEAKAAGQTYTMASNGPVALDLAATPLKIEGDEVTFAVQIDVSILLHDILQELARAGAATLGALTLSALAGKAVQALASLRTDVAGDALGIGVRELSGMLTGDAGANVYTGFRDAPSKLRAWLPKDLSAMSLLRHFVVAVLYASSNLGAQVLGTSVGASLGAALLPAGGSTLVVVLGTAAVAWFGAWVVHTVAVKLPILWKLRKLAKLHAAAAGAPGDQAARDRYGAYADELSKRLVAEMNQRTGRWTFFELAMGAFKEAYDGGGAAALAPYRPVVEAALDVLRMRTMDEDWYAARMFWQLKAAIGELPSAQE